MLVQAAQTGARSRLFLLDEVDAALDESNQARVAALLHRMCAPGAPQRCQVRGHLWCGSGRHPDGPSATCMHCAGCAMTHAEPVMCIRVNLHYCDNNVSTQLDALGFPVWHRCWR